MKTVMIISKVCLYYLRCVFQMSRVCIAVSQDVSGVYTHTRDIHFIRGRPTWDDRFSQYGIKVNFWGSGTLKS